MTRLRIYSAGTGRLQFDSDGSAADVTEPSVKRDFKADLLLYYDPGRNGLRCYVKLVRSGSEQFMADYEYDASETDPLASFKSTLEREVDDVGWRVETDAGYEQQVYESLGSAGETSPDVSRDDLQYLLDAVGQIRIGTPDEPRAVGVVSYLRRAFDDSLDIAVTYSGETGTHRDVDAVVVPGATETVTVTRDQRAALARRRLDELGGALSGVGVGGAASSMRRALADAGAEDRLGLAIEARDASVPGTAAGKRNAVLTALALVPLALLAVVVRAGGSQLLPALTRRQGFYLPFAELLDGVLPVGVPPYLFDFTSWHVVLVSTLVVAVALVITPPVQRTLTALTGISLPGLARAGGGAGPTPADRARAAVDELVALQRIAETDGAVDDVLGEFGLETGSQSARARTALGVQAAGVVAGVVVGAATFLVASMGARVVFGLLVERWTLVLDLFIAGGVLATLGTLGAAGFVLVGDLVGGRTATSSGTYSGGSAGSVQGPAGRRQPSFDVDSFERQVGTSPQQAVGRAGAALTELRRQASPNPRTKRLANALDRLSQQLPDTQFRLDGDDRALVDRHAERQRATSIDDIAGKQPAREATGGRSEAAGRAGQRPAKSSTPDGRPGDESDGSASGADVESGGEESADAVDDDEDYLYPQDDRKRDADGESESEADGEERQLSGSVDRLDVSGVDPDPDLGSGRGNRDDDEGGDRDGGRVDDGGGDGPFRNARTTSGSDAATDATTSASETGASGVTGATRAASFTQFRFDAANTGRVRGADPIRTPARAWGPVFLDEECTATPLVWGGHVLVGTREGRLYALSLTDGTDELVAAHDAALVATPAVVDDHLVVATVDGDVTGYALDGSEGGVEAHRSWHHPGRVGTPGTGATAAPTVVDDRVVVAGADGRVHAFEGSTGESCWAAPYESGDGVTLAAPAVCDGSVYVANDAGTLHAIDVSDGTERWVRSLGGERVVASPAVDDGRVVVGDVTGTLWVVDTASERIVAKDAVGTEIISSPALADGTAYVVSNVGGSVSQSATKAERDPESEGHAVVTAFDVAGPGGRQWKRSLGAMSVSSPTLVDDHLYVGTEAGRLAALDCRRGDRVWDDPLAADSSIQASVAVAGDGVYVPEHDGRVWGVVDETR
jgi:outer membrane protein assembly factor BamB